MLRRTLGALVCTLVLAIPAVAQEQRGSIEGIVKDAQGGVLPGATVEAKSAAGASVTAVTDSAGVFRFPALSPGVYDVTAALAGFNTGKFERVELLLGQIKRLDFVLSIAGVAESIQVTGESPLVDVRQSARATSIRAEQLDLLPKGRDFTTLIVQAAGTNNEAKLGGISIDGASAGENRFIVDGAETTNIQKGISGTNLIADFVDEVQVKSSGYTAEYGGALGGVVNVVTKSGTNVFRGYGLLYVQSDNLESGYRPSLRRDPMDNTKAQYWTFPEDNYRRLEPGFGFGGPISKDKMWFFGAYQPALTTTTRTVNAETSGNPKSSTWSDVEQKQSVQYVTANTTMQLGGKLRTRLAYNNSWAKTNGRLPAIGGTTAQTALLNIDSTYPNWTLAGNLDWVAKPSLYFGVRAGYRVSNTHDTGVPIEPNYSYSRGNVGQAGVPPEFQHAAGYTSIFTNSGVTYDKQDRLYFQTDGTWYAHFGGQHTFKGGIQVDHVGNPVLSGEQKNLVRLQWNASLSGQRGAYGYYQVRSNGAKPDMGFITEGSASTTDIGLFIQDAWTIGNRLTVNVGLRTEREKVPTYITGDPTLPKYGVQWGFGDKLAPRVGAAYDIKGDGKWKAYGSWGIFYDIFKLELPRGSWGGEKWLEYYYTLDTYDYNTLLSPCPSGPTPTTPCAGTLIRGPIDYRHVGLGADYVQPDLKPFEMKEASAGFDHQLTAQTAIGVRYVHKSIVRAIEDTGALDAQQNEIYIIANPGFGLTQWAYPGVALPKAKRQYDSVELRFDKRFANNWSLSTSYMWSRLWGNYSGLSQSDENGRLSPNVGRAFDYPIMCFDEHGQPVYGNLATDRPHQFKVQGIYAFKFGTSVGANFYAASGIPVTRELAVIPPNNFPVQYLGRMSDGRMPFFSQTDIFVQHEFRMGGARRLQLSLNVLNLFNQKTATNRNITYQDVNGITVNEAQFYAGQLNFDQLIKDQGIVQSPLYMKDNGYQGQLIARFGVKLMF